MLGRGELRCIGATTLDEYRKYIEKDPALERRFQQVFVGQPSVAETISILRGLRDRCGLQSIGLMRSMCGWGDAIVTCMSFTSHWIKVDLPHRKNLMISVCRGIKTTL